MSNATCNSGCSDFRSHAPGFKICNKCGEVYPMPVRTSIRKGTSLTWYKWTYQGILTAEEAAEAQKDAGYHPAGYGFYSHNVKDGITTWECSNSCE